MMRSSLIYCALVIFGGAAYADEPMTRDAVVAAAKDGVEFVGNTYCSAPQRWSTGIVSPAVST